MTFIRWIGAFNVLETAAGNEGTAGNLIGVGMGMNAGMGFAGQMAGLAGQHMNTQANSHLLQFHNQPATLLLSMVSNKDHTMQIPS